MTQKCINDITYKYNKNNAYIKGFCNLKFNANYINVI